HRDLKPANILLQGTGNREQGTEDNGHLLFPVPCSLFPKISDFGLAKHLAGADDATLAARPTQTGALLGTPHYMAPEQVAGKSSQIGPSIDVYALGAILYELLTGRPPFLGETALDVLEQVKYREPLPARRLQPDVPPELEAVCLTCLAKSPNLRYAS